jgi:3-hydroxybutyryl-CoA dehydrogenase
VNILICGSENESEALKKRLPEYHTVYQISEISRLSEFPIEEINIFFDLEADKHPERINAYAGIGNHPLFTSVLTKSLAQIYHDSGSTFNGLLFGFAGISAFFSAPLWEISSLQERDKLSLENAMNALGIEGKIVDDRSGLVGPRVISMIINEACFLFQEGSASMKDVDLAMKLGTNYPYGPFEWADKIGAENVLAILDGLLQETGNPRYKASSFLRKTALRKESFRD